MTALPIWKHLLKRSGIPYPGLDISDITFKRFMNLRQVEQEFRRGETQVKALPSKLVIEATNVCNLHCPGCFTGRGENGRVRSSISIEFFKKVMDEIGGTLTEVEFFNWGEPLLCKSIYAMIEDATRRGIGTYVTTNFSVPFDEARAEALVKSGLKHLGVSLDGATQAGYEPYRRGGDISKVIANARMIAEAKRKLNSKTPHMVWSFHVFEHNVHEIEMARSMADDIGFNELVFNRGFTMEEEDNASPALKNIGYILGDPQAGRCMFLWRYAVIHNDGGVASCCGTFHHEDDLGRMSVRPGDGGSETFTEIWNSKAFQDARGLFSDGKREAEPHLCGSVCADCPASKIWWRFQEHTASGGTRETFSPGVTSNEGFRFFQTRKPPTRDINVLLRPVREPKKKAPEIV